MTKTILGLACCWTVPAMATDAPDFTTLYNLYKNLATQNDITVTADITSTRLLNTPGAQATVINGGGFNFDGAGYLGFVISNGYNFSLTRGGEFTMDGTTANITNSLTGFSNSSYGGVISNLGGNTVIDNSAFTNNVSASGGGVRLEPVYPVQKAPAAVEEMRGCAGSSHDPFLSVEDVCVFSGGAAHELLWGESYRQNPGTSIAFALVG